MRTNGFDAIEFAKVLLPALEFDTLGSREKILAAWLIRDLGRPRRAS